MEFQEYRCDKKNNRVLLVTDIHYCPANWHDTPTDKRMELLCRDLKNEYELMPYDAILCLGDYSLDFWAYKPYGSYLNNPSVSNTKNFMNEVYPNFPLKAYMIPGNHEQYGEEDWIKITGFPRKYSIVYGDYVFLMCDTFGGNLDPNEHSDGTYTGIGAEFLSYALKKYKTKKIIICAHDICPDLESDTVRQMIYENKNIMCAFTGHTHKSNTIFLPENWRRLPVFYCGDYSYSIYKTSLKSNINRGFRTLELDDTFSTQYHKMI